MIVGTAGHIDHGKSALVRALTGVDPDRLPEEKARGITIDLGFAYRPGPSGRTLGFVDVPGHERFVGTMVAGATGIDLLMLVVAADDGIMPQTREHVAIADLLGIGRAVVVLSKADLADAGRRAAVRAGIEALLAPTGFAGAPVLPVSVRTGEGLAELGSALDEAALEHGGRDPGRRFRLAVDRSFTLAGAGTIVTGTVLSGTAAVGDRVTLSPRGLEARVRGIHAGNRPAERGRAGERCALNLAGVERDAVSRGAIVLDPALHAPTERVDVRLRVLAGEPKALPTWMPVRFHHAAEETGARLVPLSRETGPPRAELFAQIVLERPIAAAVGDRFVLRDTSARRTIGGGILLDLRAPARKRRTPERLAQLEAMRAEPPDRAVSDLLGLPPHVLDLDAFARDRALALEAAQRIAERSDLVLLRVPGARLVASATRWSEFGQGVGAILAAFHEASPDLQGLAAERLRMASAWRLPRPVFAGALTALAEAGTVVVEGSWVRLPGHVARLTGADEALWARIAPLLAVPAERFRPPRVRDIAGRIGVPEPAVRRLCKLAARMGRVDEVAHDHFFTRTTVAEMVGIVASLSHGQPSRQFTAAEFRDRVDNGRKVAIQILEFFDRHGVTMRRGDLRRLDPHRADLFGTGSGEAPPGPAVSTSPRPAGPGP